MKNILGHSSAFKYTGHSTERVEKLILQTEDELSTERTLNQLHFLSYVRIATMVVMLVIMLLFL
jgi:hypothetical protein